MCQADSKLQDPLQPDREFVATGYLEVGIGKSHTFNILAVQVDKLVLQALAGNWDHIQIAGLDKDAASLDFAELYNEHVLNRIAIDIRL